MNRLRTILCLCAFMLIRSTAAQGDITLDANTNIAIETRGPLGNSAAMTRELLSRNLLAALRRDSLEGEGAKVTFIIEADAETWSGLVGKIDRLTQVDAYTITIADNPATIHLRGRTAKACSYAVTDFLEHNLDLLWFMPGELGLCLPQAQTSTLTPGKRSAEPAVASRVYTGLDLKNPALGKFGYDGRVHKEGYYFKSHDALKALRLHHMTYASHALVRVFDVNEFGKTDPDIYPWIKGKRYIPPTDRSAPYYQNWHVCFTNPKVVDIATRKAKEYFAANGGQTFSLGINDGVNSKCACDHCTKVGTAQAYFDFVNAVAKRVKKDYPLPFMIGVLAYGDVGLPTEGLQLEDNVLVLNGVQYFQGIAKNLAAYEYAYGWGFWVPNFPLDTMKRNALIYRDMGVMALHAEVYPMWAFDAPKVYLRSRLLWEPDLDVHAALAKFCDAAFGAGGPAMTRFYEHWAALTDKYIPQRDPSPMVDIGAFRHSEVQFKRVNASDYDHAFARLAEARKATDDKLVHRRLDMIDSFTSYSRTLYDMWLNKQRIFAADGDMKSLQAEAITLGDRRATLLRVMREHNEWFTGTNLTVDRILGETFEGRWEWTIDYEHECAVRTAAVALGPETHLEPAHLGDLDVYHKQYNQNEYTAVTAAPDGDAMRFTSEGGTGKRYLRGAFAITQGEQYLSDFNITASDGELVIKLHNMNVCGKTAIITENFGPQTQTIERRIALKPVASWGNGGSRKVTVLDVEVLWHPHSDAAKLEGTSSFGRIVLGAKPPVTQAKPQPKVEIKPTPPAVIDNFNFEAGDAGPETKGQLPPGWERAIASLAGVEIVNDARPGSTGKNALRLAGSDELPTTGIISPMKPIVDDKPLHVSFWIRDEGDQTNNRKPHIAIEWYDAQREKIVVMPGTKMNYVYLNPRKTGKWELIEKTFAPSPSGDAFNRYEHVPAGAAYFTLRVNLMQYPGPAVFDDFIFSQNAKPTTQPSATLPAKTQTNPKLKTIVAWLGDTSQGNRHGPKEAAVELAHFMSAALGSKVPTYAWADAPKAERVMLVTHAAQVGGKVADALRDKRRDAFVMRYPYQHDDRTVCLLASADEYGCDYPTYYFLTKHMNVHWVGPGEDGEVIPNTPNWTLPSHIDELQNPDFEMRLWSDRGMKMARPILAGSGRMGFHHALGTIFDPKKYGHIPEVYPLVDGKRYIPTEREGHRRTSGWQPCISHPKSIEIATDSVLKTLENGRAISASLSVNDGSSNWCQCDGCIELSPDLTERFFRFYNTVTERVVKVNPNAYIGVLAYGPCSQPPKETRIHDRIVVFVTGGDPLRFGDIGGGRAVYFYHLDNAYPTVRHFPNLLAEYVRTVRDAGGIAMYTQIEQSWAAGGPKTYLLAHLLWDADTDVDATLDRYMQLTFGPSAAAPMRSYFDRWEDIFNRQPRAVHFSVIEGWMSNHLDKHKHVTWDDLAHFDKVIADAAAATKTEKQAARFDYFQKYYLWTRANLAQYLIARDLCDAAWLAARTPDQVLDAAQQAVALTDDFEQRWERDIASDRTGWLLNARAYPAVEKGMRYYDSLLVGPIRTTVEGYLAECLQTALANVAQRRGDNAIAYLKAQASSRESLQPYIGPLVDSLSGIEHPNVLPNASFEEGQLVAGEPPKLPGWWFYDRVGMVLGAKAEYEWSDQNSRDGKKCIGFGPGKYPGARAFIKLEPGRYQLVFWHRSKNRTRPITINVLQMIDSIDSDQLDTAEKVHDVSMVNDNFIKFFSRNYPAAGDQWARVEHSVEVKKAATYCLMLEPFFMDEDAWVWIDDMEFRKVW